VKRICLGLLNWSGAKEEGNWLIFKEENWLIFNEVVGEVHLFRVCLGLLNWSGAKEVVFHTLTVSHTHCFTHSLFHSTSRALAYRNTQNSLFWEHYSLWVIYPHIITILRTLFWVFLYWVGARAVMWHRVTPDFNCCSHSARAREVYHITALAPTQQEHAKCITSLLLLPLSKRSDVTQSDTWF